MAKGYNVRYVTDIAPPGITDEKLAEIAIEHRATIITQDANFTQLKKTFSEKVKIIYLKPALQYRVQIPAGAPRPLLLVPHYPLALLKLQIVILAAWMTSMVIGKGLRVLGAGWQN